MTLEPVDVCDSMRLMNVSASSDSSLGFFGFLFPFYFFFSEERKEREKNRKEIYRYIDIYKYKAFWKYFKSPQVVNCRLIVHLRSIISDPALFGSIVVDICTPTHSLLPPSSFLLWVAAWQHFLCIYRRVS